MVNNSGCDNPLQMKGSRKWTLQQLAVFVGFNFNLPVVAA